MSATPTEPQTATFLERECPKCGAFMRPRYHGKVPCQQGCPEPWQLTEGRVPSRYSGTPHLRWTCERCGYPNDEYPADDPVITLPRDAAEHPR